MKLKPKRIKTTYNNSNYLQFMMYKRITMCVMCIASFMLLVIGKWFWFIIMIVMNARYLLLLKLYIIQCTYINILCWVDTYTNNNSQCDAFVNII